jgi:hypothetical protein
MWLATPWQRWSVWCSLCWGWRPSVRVRQRGRWAVMKNLKKWARSHEDRFPKTLFTLSWCRIVEDNDSGDLLSRSHIHVDDRDEVALAAQQQRRRKTRCVGSSWLFIVAIFVAVTHIYREYMSRVIASCNRLCLSLSNRIRHRLIVKINGKRKLRTCEALGQILVEYSHARCAPEPIASPQQATPWWGHHFYGYNFAYSLELEFDLFSNCTKAPTCNSCQGFIWIPIWVFYYSMKRSSSLLWDGSSLMWIPYQSRSQSLILYKDVFYQRWVCSYILLLMILRIDCYLIMLWW